MNGSRHYIESNKLTVEKGARLKLHEWRMVEWIVNNLPFDIVVKRESIKQGVESADIMLDNELFEMKSTAGSLGTLDGHVRKANNQSRGRGALINIGSPKYNNMEAIVVIMNRMQRSGLSEVYLLRDYEFVVRLVFEDDTIAIKSHPPTLQ